MSTKQPKTASYLWTYPFFVPQKQFLYWKKNRNRNHFRDHHWQFCCALFWPVSNKYIYKFYEVREIHRHVQADTYVRYKYFRYLFVIFRYFIHLFVLLDATSGPWQMHNMSMHLIFLILASTACIFFIIYNFFTRKKTIVETILVGITNNFDVHCFDLYQIYLQNLPSQRDAQTLCSSWHLHRI